MIPRFSFAKFFMVSTLTVLYAANFSQAANSPWGTTDKGILKPLAKNIQLPIKDGALSVLPKSTEAQINIVNGKCGIFSCSANVLTIKTKSQEFFFEIKKLDWQKLQSGSFQTTDQRYTINAQLKKRLVSDTIDLRDVSAKTQTVCVEEENWCADVFDDPSGQCRSPRSECKRYEQTVEEAYQYCARWIVNMTSFNIEILDQNQAKLAVFEGAEEKDINESERNSDQCK